MIHLYVHLLVLYILNLGAVSETFALVFCAGRVLEPSGGGQLQHAGEESRASLEECSSWLGWTARGRIGREMWMCEICIVSMTLRLSLS